LPFAKECGLATQIALTPNPKHPWRVVSRSVCFGFEARHHDFAKNFVLFGNDAAAV
jgi:hypothetical protein